MSNNIISSSTKRQLSLITVCIGLGIACYFGLSQYRQFSTNRLIDQCIKTGGSIAESWPLQCIKPHQSNTLSDSTTNWQTYTDTTLGYTISYPGNWYFEKGQPPEILFNLQNYLESQVSVDERNKMSLNSDKIAITFGSYPNTITKNKDLTTWLRENDQYISDMSGAPMSVTQTLIAGNEGLILNYAGTGDFYVFKAGKHVFYSYFNPDNSELKSTFDQILSTFKFTDSLGSNIYKNEKFGISFEIPEGVMLDTSYSEKYTSDYWEIKLNIQDNDDILIQKGSPAGWTDCKKNVAEKTGKVNSLEYSYFKEIDDFEVCKLEGTSTYVGWYATISDGPLDRNDNNSWFISAKTESTDQIYRQKIESVFFKVLNTFKSLDVLP